MNLFWIKCQICLTLHSCSFVSLFVVLLFRNFIKDKTFPNLSFFFLFRCRKVKFRLQGSAAHLTIIWVGGTVGLNSTGWFRQIYNCFKILDSPLLNWLALCLGRLQLEQVCCPQGFEVLQPGSGHWNIDCKMQRLPITLFLKINLCSHHFLGNNTLSLPRGTKLWIITSWVVG